MMLQDSVLRSAISPEHAVGADKVLSAVATVSDVELSADLRVRPLNAPCSPSRCQDSHVVLHSLVPFLNARLSRNYSP